jgi:hypothetical protein
VRCELKAADGCFSSVPISNSDESHLLRIAHAQRVISSFLCDIVWQPFSSEHTLQHPEFIGSLGIIADQLAKSNHGNSAGGRAETVWASLTMRALQSLERASPSAPNSTAQDTQVPSRADTVVSEVLRVLAPLVNPAQSSRFRNEVADLAHSATLIWNCAQTGELKLSVRPTLDLENHLEWRSTFDDETAANTAFSTHPRTFTLFPRVITKEVILSDKSPGGPPGSWPELKQGPLMLETCIHPGTGMLECSSVVIRGKDEGDERLLEEEEKRKHFEEYIEMAKKEWKPPSKRNGSSSR